MQPLCNSFTWIITALSPCALWNKCHVSVAMCLKGNFINFLRVTWTLENFLSVWGLETAFSWVRPLPKGRAAYTLLRVQSLLAYNLLFHKILVILHCKPISKVAGWGKACVTASAEAQALPPWKCREKPMGLLISLQVPCAELCLQLQLL